MIGLIGSGEAGSNMAVCSFRLPRGERITVRPIRPHEADLLQNYIRSLSSESRRNRFLGAVGELSPAGLAQLTRMDRHGGAALLAFADGRDTVPIAESMIVKLPNSERCELALSVADSWQGKGVGARLLRNLECQAKRLGARFLFGEVLRTNTAMKCLARKEGFSIGTPFTDARLVEVGKDLSSLPSGSLCAVGWARPALACPDLCAAG